MFQQHKELLIGAGNQRRKKIFHDSETWRGLVTLDIDPSSRPDVIHDLCDLPLPFSTGEFTEIHAYEVLEHTGQQGDWRFFFAQWSEFYRILKPGGLFFGTCPAASSPWAWGDPGHTRIISLECLTFLSQDEYKKQLGKTAMTDYRSVWRGDFRTVFAHTEGGCFSFVLQAVSNVEGEPDAATV